MAKNLKAAEKADLLRKLATTIEIIGDKTVIGDNVMREVLVDDFGLANECAKITEATANLLKEVVKSRRLPDEVFMEGENYAISMSEQSRTSLNVEKVKAVVPADILQDCYSITSFEVWRTSKKNRSSS